MQSGGNERCGSGRLPWRRRRRDPVAKVFRDEVGEFERCAPGARAAWFGLGWFDPLERGAIPLGKVSSCVVGALQKGEQGIVRRAFREQVVVQVDELPQVL